MKINISFPAVNSTCYDVKSLDLGILQQIKMQVDEMPEGAKWFSNNDEVLSIAQSGDSATINSLAVGQSTILFIVGTAVMGSIDINVVNDQATSLNLRASAPIIE